MKKDSSSILRVFLLLGDLFAIVLAFAFSYYLRAYIDPRPYYFETELSSFMQAIVLLAPMVIIIIASLGLYTRKVINSKSRLVELWRLFLASVISTMSLISYDFLCKEEIFPTRIMALYAIFSCFAFLVLFRMIIRLAVELSFKSDHGTRRALIVGNSINTTLLAEYITNNPEAGYRLSGIVAAKKYLPKDLKDQQYSSVKDALRATRRPDVIFQTDGKNTEYVYRKALDRHIPYYFVPSESELSSRIGELELIGNTPAMLIQATPLVGGMEVLKRILDIVFSIFAIILAAIPMAIIWLCIKISDPKNPAIYKSIRLTQYNRRFKFYKFRSMRKEYSDMGAKEAFTKMGRPELYEKYVKNGDFIKDDPRITKLGRFLRATSLDELPQFFNVLKGDMSVVGPRSLMPGDLEKYGDRSMILTVKSGITGLAQVSGRRDIPFIERRAIDIYYVKNWSLLLDIQILFKTIRAVFKREGAK